MPFHNESTETPTWSSILPKGNFINGEWLTTGIGEFTEVRNKYNQELIGRVPNASDAQVESAIEAAHQAFAKFRNWSSEKRRSHLEKLLSLFRENADEFGFLIAAEAGKPTGYARGEVARCETTLSLAIDLCHHFSGEEINVDYNAGVGKMAFTHRFPMGPVACISPFNFPLNLALHKIAPALAVGCPVLLKPSPFAPLSALAFAGLCEKAGYPEGFLNIFLADIPQAEKMVTDDRLKLLSFTGSPKVGWELKSKAGKKKVVLELGGNAAVVVDETADLQAIAKTIAIGSFLYAGQICISTQRIIVVENIWQEFIDLMRQETEALGVGNPFNKDVSVGPLIDAIHLDRIESWVNSAVAAGGEVLTGGKVIDREKNLYAPTLLTNVPASEKIVCEEAFGPVAILEKAPDFEAAIARANDTVFGLQAGVFTQRVDRMKYAFRELEVGGVMINNIPGFRVDGMPYGGIKESGLGREGLKYAMMDMTEEKILIF